MASKRKLFRNREFYINRANAARQLSLEISEEELHKCCGDQLKRNQLLEGARILLKGTLFERDHTRPAGRDSPLAPTPGIGYLLGRFYLQAFQQIASGRTHLLLRKIADTIRIDSGGKISTSFPSSLSYGYQRFLHDLPLFDARRIKECPECQAIFYGRKNSIYCSDNCTQKHWRTANPEAYQDAQSKRDDQRKQARASARIRREKERWERWQ